jgi:DNA-binding MarR family transcriptional regulator
MALEGRRLLVLIRRLSAVDARARRRLMRLMDIGETEASVVLALAAGGPLTRADLRAQLELSAGGAEALTRKLVDQALVVREPDPNDRTRVRLRLSDGADVELAAALHRLIDHFDTIAAGLTDVDARLVGSFVDAMETPVRLSTAQPRPIE